MTLIIRSAVLLLLISVVLSGCNRANVRVPGASVEMTSQPTKFVAKNRVRSRVIVLAPVDLRPAHYGEKVAGTDWKACETDSLTVDQAKAAVQRQLIAALVESRIFSDVRGDAPSAGDIVVQPEIHALCSSVYGVLFARAAGISAVHLKVTRGADTLFAQKFERVVVDNEPEYSGSQVTFIEQAMRTLMSDSLRELSRNFVIQIEKDVVRWKL